jgi:hypothetical protein
VTYARSVPVSIVISISVPIPEKLVGVARRRVYDRASGQTGHDALDGVEQSGVCIALLEDVLERGESN